MKVSDFEIAREVAYFMKRLYLQRLTTTTGGNISFRRGDEIFITPGSTDKARMETEEIGILDLEGNILKPGFKPTVEAVLHLSVYRSRPDICAVIHAHPETVCGFAASEAEISTKLLCESDVILGAVGRAPYFAPGTQELAQAVSTAAADHDVFLMNNHGAMALGTSLLQAYSRIEVLERAAKATLMCQYMLKSANYMD